MSYNLQVLGRNPWGEISGSLGDLGTLLPIMTALATAHLIDFNSTLIFTGVFNILSGMFFGVPIPVQPMKAIASVALSTKMGREETMGAGLSVGAVILLLSITGLLERASRLVPIPIVKGIQVGAGLSLILNAGAGINLISFPYGWEQLFWAIFATTLVFATSRNTRFPFALIIFVLGLAWAFPGTFPSLRLQKPSLSPPPSHSIYTGFLTAGAGQLPLTILNSIIAVNQLSQHLLPFRAAPSINSLGISVGIMNLIGCSYGSMPVCHGRSGGLAGQYRCGARSGSSIMFLGTLKLFVGIFVGDGLLRWLQSFPTGLLGALIFLAGLELVSVGRTLNTTAPDLPHSGLNVDQTGNLIPRGPLSEEIAEERWILMTITAGALIMFKNDFVGFAAGYAYLGLLRLQEYYLAYRAL
ncbi:SulP family sulfate permease [Terfezia claveryi]|nr:SulP family sulfate permease [Terfezia claveryi]